MKEQLENQEEKEIYACVYLWLLSDEFGAQIRSATIAHYRQRSVERF